MISDTLFVAAYALVPMISIAAFIPQIMKLLNPNTSLEGLSFGAWWAWMLSATISVVYGVFYLHDFMFIVSSTVAFSFNIIVLALAYRKLLGGSGLKIDARVNHDVNNIADQMHHQRYQSEYIECAEHDRVIAINYALIPEQPKTIQ